MSLIIDPAENEVRALRRAASWRGRRVLEIGCGDGRLTLRMARLGAQVQAIDPDAKSIRRARTALPKRFAARVEYRTGHAEALGYPDASFDCVVLAWAL